MASDAENRREHAEMLEEPFQTKKEIEGHRKHLALIEGLEGMLDTMKEEGKF